MQGLARAKLQAVLDESLVAGRALPPQNFQAAIALVGEKGMADVAHVSAYLVRASRFQATFHECGVTIAFQHAPMRDGRLACVAVGRKDGHTQTVFRVSPDVTLDAALVFYEVAPHQSHIRAIGLMVEELLAQV